MKKQQPKRPKSPLAVLAIPAADLKQVVGGQAPQEERRK